MTLPFAALGALVAALIETTVLPELPIAGAQPDLVLALAVAAALALAPEDGLVWAFVGGLLLDMLIPARPIGSTTITLLLVVGVAALGGLVLGRPFRLAAVVGVFVLTWVFHALLLGVLVLTEGVALDVFEPRLVLIAALLNMLIAIPAAVLFAAVARRIVPERVDW